MPVVHFWKGFLFKSHFIQCLHCYHCYVLYSLSSGGLPGLLRVHAQEPFESIRLLRCHRSIIVHRYVQSVCFLACFGSPGLSGKAQLGGIKRPGALRSKTAHRLGPVPLTAPMFQQTSGDAHDRAHSCARTLSHTVNTALSCPQAQHSAALIEFQTQSMLQGNCIVNQCLSDPRQWSGLHSPFLQIGYEGYTVV